MSTPTPHTHTEVPWKIDREEVDAITDQQGHRVCKVFGDDGEFDQRLHLIAQAPALREASEGLIRAFYAPDYDRHGEMIASAVRQLQAVLAQIEKG